MGNTTEANVFGIVGMTGGGKTTLGKSMAELLGADFYDELHPSLNEYFEAFYDFLVNGVVPNPAAYNEQKRFLDSSLEISEEMKKKEFFQMMWVMPPVGHFMYAFLLYKGGHLKKEEFVDYCQYFVDHVAQAVSPNTLLVVLNKESAVLQERLEERASQESIRENETQVDESYWNDQYLYWRERLENGENFPLKELQEILPADVFIQFAELTSIPMFVLFSDEIDWTTENGAQHVRDQKLVTEFGVLAA
jgi:deoxyadenosine/deoxycytidine kinase